MERGPRTKPRMDAPKARAKGAAMPREARRRLMKEYMAQSREKAGEYGAGDDGGKALEKEAVQKVEDIMRGGAESAGRAGRQFAKDGADNLVRRVKSQKARRRYVAEKAHSTQRAGRSLASERGGTAAGKAVKGTGGKRIPKGRPGAALPKTARPGAKTSKAALATRKMGRAGAAQLKQRAAKAAQAAAKSAAQGARRMAQMLLRAARAIVKLLSVVVSAAGPFVLILAAFAGIAMMIASPFGLFFSGEDTGAGIAPVSAVIREAAEDFNGKMREIQDANIWDDLQIHYSGRRGNNWRDILAVFSVKTVLYDENAADVVTIDSDRAERIKAVFWDMTEVSHRIEEVPHRDDDTDAITYTYTLHITITQRDAAAQAERYIFTQDQKDVLAEMLGGAYDEYFSGLIAGAGEIGSGTPVVGIGSYIWPSDSSGRVTSYFGPRTHPVTGEEDDHYGIDIGAAAGTNILAANAGRVVTAEWHWSYGNHVIIDHGGGRRTLYAHMSLLVAGVGQNVAQGEVIGLVGATGVTDGEHIHFETHVNGGRVDPLSYFSGYG